MLPSTRSRHQKPYTTPPLRFDCAIITVKHGAWLAGIIAILLMARVSFYTLQVERIQGSGFIDQSTTSSSPAPAALNASFVCDSTNQYCTTPLQGEWVYTPNKEFNNPLCYPWDQADMGSAPDICGTNLWPQSSDNFDRNAAQHYSGSNTIPVPEDTVVSATVVVILLNNTRGHHPH